MRAVNWRVTGIVDHRLAEDIGELSIDGLGVVDFVFTGETFQCAQRSVIHDLVTHGTTDTVHCLIVHHVVRIEHAIWTEQ